MQSHFCQKRDFGSALETPFPYKLNLLIILEKITAVLMQSIFDESEKIDGAYIFHGSFT